MGISDLRITNLWVLVTSGSKEVGRVISLPDLHWQQCALPIDQSHLAVGTIF